MLWSQQLQRFRDIRILGCESRIEADSRGLLRSFGQDFAETLRYQLPIFTFGKQQ